MKSLKIKNCEGFDRIPLKILNEGAEYLIKPMTRLMQMIYNSKTVPDQWRIEADDTETSCRLGYGLRTLKHHIPGTGPPGTNRVSTHTSEIRNPNHLKSGQMAVILS